MTTVQFPAMKMVMMATFVTTDLTMKSISTTNLIKSKKVRAFLKYIFKDVKRSSFEELLPKKRLLLFNEWHLFALKIWAWCFASVWDLMKNEECSKKLYLPFIKYVEMFVYK